MSPPHASGASESGTLSGQTLDALQELTRTAVQRRLRSRVRLMVDVEGYRARRRDSLADYARSIAERAKDRGTEIELEPMTAYERKIVHDAVAAVDPSEAERVRAWADGAGVDVAIETSQTFRVVSRFHRAIGVITIVASAIFLLCVMIIRVDERRRDMGMLRLIGVGRGTVFRAIVLEAIGIALVGSAAGAALGVVILVLFVILFAWIALSFASMLGGLIALVTRRTDELGLAADAPLPTITSSAGSTTRTSPARNRAAPTPPASARNMGRTLTVSLVS